MEHSNLILPAIAFVSLIVSATSLGIALRALLRGPDIRIRPPHVAAVQTGGSTWAPRAGYPSPWTYQCNLLVVNQGRRAGILEEFLPNPVTVTWKGSPPTMMRVGARAPYLRHPDGGPVHMPLVVKDGEIVVVRLDLNVTVATTQGSPAEQFAADLRRFSSFRVEFTYMVSTKKGARLRRGRVDVRLDSLKEAAVNAWREYPVVHARTLQIFYNKAQG